MLVGTGHVAYPVLPVIAEVSRRNGIRPSRPWTMAATASLICDCRQPDCRWVAVACVTMFGAATYHGWRDVGKSRSVHDFGYRFSFAVFVNKLGKELKDDPYYQALTAKIRIMKEYIDVEEQ